MSMRDSLIAALRYLPSLPGPEDFRRYWSWLKRGGWALLDQGFFSAGHFFLNVLLARWLTPAMYGAFSVSYAILYLLITIHGALFAEPMMVYGAGRYLDRFEGYFRRLLFAQVILTLSVSLVIGGAATLFIGSNLVAEPLLGMAVALPSILVLWQVRKAFYVRSEVHKAVVLSTTYLVALGFGIYGINEWKAVSALSAMLIIGAAALLASIILLPQFSMRRSDVEGPPLKQILKNHWAYGLPATGSVLTRWGQDNLPYLVLPVTAGLGATGAFRAVMNFILPSRQIMNALYNVLVPALSRRWQDIAGSGVGFRKMVIRIAGIMIVMGAAYGTGLVAFREEIFALLYGGEYGAYARTLLVAALLAPLYGALIATTSALAAMERPDRLFAVYGLAMGVSVIVGVPFMTWYGVAGALSQLVLSVLVGTVTSWHFMRKTVSA